MTNSNGKKPETAVSKWARGGTNTAKVGKGLLKNNKAQHLALRHWLEATDPSHRYGHNLYLYYDVWSVSKSNDPFFFWLDNGDGKEVNIERCPRTLLERQCITYLGPKEREAYEVIVEEGTLIYRRSKELVETINGSKWIFVLSTTRRLYIGRKVKGVFQHSSFVSGAAVISAGIIVVHSGVLEGVWSYSGHYLPTKDNLQEFINFLRENQVDLTNVKINSFDDGDFLALKRAKSYDLNELKANRVDSTVVEFREQKHEHRN